MRRALEQSLNAATVWMAESVGYDAVVRAAREAGFTSPLEPVPALVLGSFEVTPIELAAAYAAFASGGERIRPTGLRAVVDREGGVSQPRVERAPGLQPDEAFLITHLLKGVIDRGTGASARALGVEGPVAGKTGTTNEGRDTWFVGYTPRLIALVWVGFDQRDVLRLSGAQAALPIWADFMRTALGVVPADALRAADLDHLPRRGRRQRQARDGVVPDRHPRGVPRVDRAARVLPRPRSGRRGPLVLPPPLRVDPLAARGRAPRLPPPRLPRYDTGAVCGSPERSS